MAWDKTLIAEGVLAPDLNNEIRDNWIALEAMLDAWMRFATGGTQTGQPRQGAARPYFQDSVPTVRLDTKYFDSNDLGTLWIDSNSAIDNQFNILTAADGAGTETWTPISTEIIAFLVAKTNTWALAQTFTATPVFSVPPTFTLGVALNNAYLTAKNAAGDGTVDLIKANASDVAILPDGSELATSGAPTANADIANKKYVDDALGQSAQAEGTSNITNSTGDWADMTNMSIAMTTVGGNVLLMFSASIKVTAQQLSCGFRFDLDGATQYHQQHFDFEYDQNADAMAVSMQYLLTSLSAGAHTFKVQWKDISGTVGNDGASYPRVFTAVELPS